MDLVCCRMDRERYLDAFGSDVTHQTAAIYFDTTNIIWHFFLSLAKYSEWQERF